MEDDRPRGLAGGPRQHRARRRGPVRGSAEAKTEWIPGRAYPVRVGHTLGGQDQGFLHRVARARPGGRRLLGLRGVRRQRPWW